MINTLCDTALTCSFADNKTVVNDAEFETAINELQWNKYSETTKTIQGRQASNDMELYDIDNLYSDPEKSSDIKELLNNSYSPIASRALVEISRQLKRIADKLDSK